MVEDLDHHAFLDHQLAVSPCREGVLELIGIDLGQVAEVSGIDAQQSDSVVDDEVGRPQHRSVTTEAETQFQPLGERGVVNSELGAADQLRVTGRHADLDRTIDAEPKEPDRRVLSPPGGGDGARLR